MVISSDRGKHIDLQAESSSSRASVSLAPAAIAWARFSQMLADWEKILSVGDRPQIYQQLKTQAQMWLALGQKIAIAEVSDIARVVLAVLANEPPLATTVARLAFKEWQSIYQSSLENAKTPATTSEATSPQVSPSPAETDFDPEAILDPISILFADEKDYIALPPSLSLEDLIANYTPEEERQSAIEIPALEILPATSVSSNETVSWENFNQVTKPDLLNTENLLVWQNKNLLFIIPSNQILEISERNLSYSLSNSIYPTLITWNNQEVRLFHLSHLVRDRDLRSTPWLSSSTSKDTLPQPEGAFLVFVKLRGEIIAIDTFIDRLVSQSTLEIQPFNPVLDPPAYIYGCTLLDEDHLFPIVNAIEALNQHVKLLAPTTQAKILVVDDSKTVREVLRMTLEEAHYQVLTAENGEEAIHCCQEHPEIKLILCDLEMPKVNGFEFLIYRRQQPELSQIPVMMLTFRSSERERKLAFQLGAAAYMNKPYLKDDLLSTIKEAIAD